MSQPSPNDAWEAAREYVEKYCDQDPDYQAVEASFALLCHCTERAFVIPFLHNYGPPGSGKTRAVEVILSISPNPSLWVDPTGPTLFRYLDQGICTLGIDETQGVVDKDIRSIFDNGYRKGGRVPRTVGRDKVKEFAVFGPKIFASLAEPWVSADSRSFPYRSYMSNRKPEFQYASPPSESVAVREMVSSVKEAFPFSPHDVNIKWSKELEIARLGEIAVAILDATPEKYHDPIKAYVERRAITLKEEIPLPLDLEVLRAVYAYSVNVPRWPVWMATTTLYQGSANYSEKVRALTIDQFGRQLSKNLREFYKRGHSGRGWILDRDRIEHQLATFNVDLKKLRGLKPPEPRQ